MIQLDDGIEIPESYNTPRNKYPFAQMQVGQSFTMSSETYDEFKKVRAAVSASARSYAAKHAGVKFVIRTVEPNKLRVWRTA